MEFWQFSTKRRGDSTATPTGYRRRSRCVTVRSRPERQVHNRQVSAFHVLVVIRHAKAEPHRPEDFQRALTAQGRADAAAAGRWLAAANLAPDAALVSAARRTQQTWQELARAADWAVEPDLAMAMYGADEYEVIDALHVIDEAVGILVVVGHNPTMHALVQLIAERSGNRAALARVETGFPTATVAVLDIAVPWAELGPGLGKLQALYTARGDREA